MGVVVAIAAAQRAQRESQVKRQQRDSHAKLSAQDNQVAPIKSGLGFRPSALPPVNLVKHPKDSPFHKLYLLKVFMKKLYSSRVSEVTFAALIMGNFVANAAEAQVASGETADKAFYVCEIFFGAAFTIELVLNLIGHWWREFWRSAWNWFDALVVVVSILNVSGGALPGLGTLRILRAFRVVRLFKRAGSLKKIIMAIGEALPGVMNAFAILMLVMCLYAILAVDLFGKQEENQLLFGKFSKALFTMFQMMTTEGWADIARDVMATSGDAYAVFFVSFILIANILLANVVIAVLIEKVIAFQDDEDEEDPDIMSDFPHIPAHFWNGAESENNDLNKESYSLNKVPSEHNSMPQRNVQRQYSVEDSTHEYENEESVRGGQNYVPDEGNYIDHPSLNEGITDIDNSEVERNPNDKSNDKPPKGRRESLAGVASRRESFVNATNNIAMMTAPLQQMMAASMAKQNKDKGKSPAKNNKNKRGSIDNKNSEQMKRFASVASAVESAKINDKLDLIITLLQEHLRNSEEMEMMSYMKDSRIDSRNQSPKFLQDTPKTVDAERMRVRPYITTSTKKSHLRQEEQTDTVSRPPSSNDHSEKGENRQPRLSIRLPLPLPLPGEPPCSERETEGSESRVSIDLQTQRSRACEDAYMVTEAEIKAVQDTNEPASKN